MLDVETAMACVKVRFQYLPGGSEEHYVCDTSSWVQIQTQNLHSVKQHLVFIHLSALSSSMESEAGGFL